MKSTNRVPCAQDEECRSSSSQGSAPVAKWDTTFNRALNRTKNVEPLAAPSSAGRVVGFGGIPWSEYYGTPERKGKKAESAEVKHLREQVEAFPNIVQDAVNKAVTAAETKFQERVQTQVQSQVQTQVNEKLNTILPVYMEKYNKWRKSGKRGPPPVPNLDSAQSDNVARPEALVTPPAGPVVVETPPAPEVDLPAAAKAPARTTAPPSGSHSATCALKPVGGGASTLAAFDALQVTKSLKRELGGSTTPMT